MPGKKKRKFYYGWVIVAIAFISMAIAYALRYSFRNGDQITFPFSFSIGPALWARNQGLGGRQHPSGQGQGRGLRPRSRRRASMQAKRCVSSSLLPMKLSV